MTLGETIPRLVLCPDPEEGPLVLLDPATDPRLKTDLTGTD